MHLSKPFFALALLFTLAACDSDSDSTPGAGTGTETGAETGASNANPDALWLAHETGLIKLDAATGDRLRSVELSDNVTGMALDPWRGTLWVLNGSALQQRASDGSLVPLPEDRQASARVQASETNAQRGPVKLVANPVDGGVWSIENTQVSRLDARGRELARQQLDDVPVTAMVTPKTGTLWLASGNRLVPISTGDDETASSIAVEAPITAAVYSPVADRFWVLAGGRIHRYTTEGVLEHDEPAQGMRLMARDGNGGVVLAGEGSLIRHSVTNDGAITRLAATDAPIRQLAVNPGNGDIWLTLADGQLRQLSAEGVTRRAFMPGELPTIRQLVVFADTLPPTVRVAAPAPDAALADDQPGLQLRYEDLGSGVALETATLELDGQILALQCESGEAGAASCISEQPLAEGAHRFTVSLADARGNRGQSPEQALRVDLTAPDVTITSSLETNQANYQLAGRVSEPARVELGTRTVDSEGTFTLETSLSPGDNAVTLRAVDRAGNTTEKRLVVILDQVAPAPVPPGELTLGAANDSGQFHLAAVEGAVEPGVRIRITNRRTGEQTIVTADSNGAFVAEVPAAVLDELALVSVDRAGNTSPESRLVVNNRTPLLGSLDERYEIIPGNRFRLALKGTDPDGQRLSFIARTLPLPDGAELDSRTGEFTFKHAPDQTGDYTLEVGVHDGEALDVKKLNLRVLPLDTSAPTRLSGRLLDANAANSGEIVPVVGAPRRRQGHQRNHPQRCPGPFYPQRAARRRGAHRHRTRRRPARPQWRALRPVLRRPGADRPRPQRTTPALLPAAHPPGHRHAHQPGR